MLCTVQVVRRATFSSVVCKRQGAVTKIIDGAPPAHDPFPDSCLRRAAGSGQVDGVCAMYTVREPNVDHSSCRVLAKPGALSQL